MLFADRAEAGQRLAAALSIYRGGDGVVLALPRGGVAVAEPVARSLQLPLDVIITRKIGAPGNPEYALGAISEVGGAQLNRAEVSSPAIDPGYLDHAIQAEREVIERQVRLFRAGNPLISVAGKVTILVDDGIATGFTMLASVRALRSLRPAWLVVAVPVAPPSTVAKLSEEADRVVALHTPEPFYAVGNWYHDFAQVSDDDVLRILDSARQAVHRRSA